MTQLCPKSSVVGVNQLEFADLAPLAILERAGLNESFHHGVAVIMDSKSKVLESHGTVTKPIYPRSALKPLQALAMRQAGLNLQDDQLVISMASHQGTEGHTQLVTQVLMDAGLNTSDLKCPRAFPGNPDTRAKSNEMSRVAMNCSGKHAGFLATSQLNGWDLTNYLDQNHPLQVRIRQLVEELAEEKVSAVTADGCGAPLFAISTVGLAKAFAAVGRVAPEMIRAAKNTPWVIGDKGAPDAVFLEHGLFAKIGAEGVFVVTTNNHEAVAIKIADGNLRAAPVVAAKLLFNHSLISKEAFESLVSRLSPKVLGGDSATGSLELNI